MMSTLNGHSHSEEISKPKLVQELYGGEIYEYYPLGEYIVAAPGICGGRPTFKYTRLQVAMVLAMLANGYTIEEIVQDYEMEELTAQAIGEAIQLASKTFVQSTQQIELEMA